MLADLLTKLLQGALFQGFHDVILGYIIRTCPRHQAVFPSHNTIVPEECIYIVIDLETTRLSHKLNNIIELAAEILLYNGVPIEDGSYSSLIRPPSTIPAVVSELTGITQEMVMDKPRFSEVIVEFFKFIEDRIKDLDDARPTKIHHTIFVGHNAV